MTFVGGVGIALSPDTTVPVLQAAEATDTGVYQCKIWTPDTGVYVGGSGLQVGSGIIPSSNPKAAYGFLLQANELYDLEVSFDNSENQAGDPHLGLFATVAGATGSGDLATLYALARLVA